MATVCGAFNNHVKEFFDDIKRVAGEDKDILAAEAAFYAAKKANATLFLKAWKRYTLPYKAEIEGKDTKFFLSKDYTSDLSTAENRQSLLEAIERVRRKVATMDVKHQEAIMGYVFNLTQLANLYQSN